jgi:enoyl-CoA hydratase
VRISAASAKMGLPAVKEGLIPGMGVYRLPRAIGITRAKRFILSGDLVDGAEAERIGMVNICVPNAELAQKVRDTDRKSSRQSGSLINCGPMWTATPGSSA